MAHRNERECNHCRRCCTFEVLVGSLLEGLEQLLGVGRWTRDLAQAGPGTAGPGGWPPAGVWPVSSPISCAKEGNYVVS